MSAGAISGTCNACGQPLVHVIDTGRTYHPWDCVRCDAMLPIAGTEFIGNDVPFEEFTPDAESPDTHEQEGKS